MLYIWLMMHEQDTGEHEPAEDLEDQLEKWALEGDDQARPEIDSDDEAINIISAVSDMLQALEIDPDVELTQVDGSDEQNQIVLRLIALQEEATEFIHANSIPVRINDFIFHSGPDPNVTITEATQALEHLMQIEAEHGGDMHRYKDGVELPSSLTADEVDRYFHVHRSVLSLDVYNFDDDEDDDDQDEPLWADEEELLANQADVDYFGRQIDHDDDEFREYDVVRTGLAGTGEDTRSWRTDDAFDEDETDTE